MVTIELPDRLRDELAALDTVSDKIRLLDNHNYARADIARILGKRYQHVRNVLEQDRTKALAEQETQSAPARGMPRHVEIGKDGMLRLPADVLSEMGLEAGGTVVVRVVDGVLRAQSLDHAIEQAQTLVRQMVPQGFSLVDELIADRRAEARQEDEA